ncbi:MAG: hypothetical protein H0W69_07415 [Gemmatimonadaceae bacterium]|nr:hypothetical protein [Gemmatimonadaceae bacterium]
MHDNKYSTSIIRSGISFGSALAIAISWSVHKSVLWAIIQGFFSWIYVIYYVVTR